ncbi:MAG TPA: GatB/YqeY domain-containing protein [Candidatus Butyricicoccus stercorigallinarum]|nr:GatB/YqeY domain-containing protein [Candidatus Butyricicoccus stercorigallinarum]
MSKTKEIQKQMMEALKAKDTARKEALSLLLSALKAKAKDKRADLTEAEEDAVIKREIKQTRETMDAAPADRQDIREDCQRKLEIYQAFAPEEMGEAQIRALVQAVLDQLQITAPTPRDKGPVMKHLMPQVKGKADGKLVNQIVGEMLQG